MWSDRKIPLATILFYVFMASFCTADTQNVEPNAAELVRTVRESENWIHNVDSFQLHIKSVWTTPEQSKKSEIVNGLFSGQPYETGTKDFLEFVFNSERIRYQSGGEDKFNMLRIWDGQRTISHERSSRIDQEHYYLSAETENLFDSAFFNISWLRSQPHSFWWHPRDVNENMDFYGQPEDFKLVSKQIYREIPCYVLEHQVHRDPNPVLVFKWFVGQSDHLLYGIKLLRNDELDTEHYMLDYQEVAPNCWFPMKQGYDLYTSWETHRDIEVVKVQINEKLPEEMFQIELKEGVEVIDNRSGQRITYIYKAPLVGKAFPSLEGISFDFDRSQAQDNPILFCFFDYQQRPSRHCITQLKNQAKELMEKNVKVVLIHASKIEQAKLDEWIKENEVPFTIGVIEAEEEQIRFNWGVQSLPWLVLTDKNHVVTAEGFSINELDEVKMNSK